MKMINISFIYLFWYMDVFNVSSQNHKIIKWTHFPLLINENNIGHCYIHETETKYENEFQIDGRKITELPINI